MTSTPTRIDAVMRDIQSHIAARTYLPGMRLPSVRAQAQRLGVSVSTVVEAYARLSAAGVMTSRPGAGFYVSGPVAPLALTRLGPPLDREVDPLWISRQALDSDPVTLKPGCGWLPANWMYETGMRRALRSLARGASAALTEYATPQGHPGLRQFIARRLRDVNIEAGPDQILLTDSGTQAIDLICRFLLTPGDTVLVDDPCYFNFHALLKAHRVQAVGVPYTPQGPDLVQFEAALREHSPRLYLTNSGIHNPTGAALSPLIAHRLLSLAERADLIIVEDDIWADFEVHPAARLAAFDNLTRVIQIGSFSKTISAAMRCGYIAARTDWIESLVDLKIATTFGGARMAEQAVLMTLTDRGYRKHIEGLRERLSVARAQTMAQLSTLGIHPWLVPRAGVHLWCRLPPGHDAARLARACLQEGVVLAPGNAFSLSASAGEFLRFNVAQCSDARIFTVLARAMAAQRESCPDTAPPRVRPTGKAPGR